MQSVLVLEGNKGAPLFSVSRYFPEKKEGGPWTRKFVYRASFFLLFCARIMTCVWRGGGADAEGLLGGPAPLLDPFLLTGERERYFICCCCLESFSRASPSPSDRKKGGEKDI